MGGSTSVRPAHPGDAAAVIAVVRTAIERSCRADHRGDPATLERWLANKTPEHFAAWIANPDNYCVVAELGGTPAGVALVNRRGEVLLFYVAPERQRQGIGTQLHAALEQEARRQRLPRLRLESTSVARRFYEARGYRAAGPMRVLFGELWAYPYEKALGNRGPP